jgi:aspartyl-tRNA(Asn)/glutamyl-tRNA(Gln) amidotransferase subunit C
MSLTKEQIQHIAQLARLELSKAELEKYGDQLSGILNYVDQLQEVNTEGVEPTAQVTGLNNIFREDAIENCPPEEIKIALNQAPGLEDGQIKVKRVLE